MRYISNIFTQDFKHWEKIDFFKRVLYLFLIANALTLLPIAQDLFGYYGQVGTRGWNTNIPNLQQGSYGIINFLSHPINGSREWIFILFIIGQFVFLVLGFFRIWPIVSSVMVYFFTVNLFLKGSLAFTGGEVLICNLLFYLMFIQTSQSKGFFKDLQNILNNTFYYMLLIQVCFLYFFSALYKTFDPNWIDGNAIMYISRIEAYSSYIFELIFSDNPVLSKVAVYASLAYQFLFPIVVWIKPVKVPFLLVGILFHLGTAFGMGIFTFGVVMIIVYIIFLDEHQINSLKNILYSAFKKSTTESV